ncbi:hypothetical protein GMD78_05970 [Ornithinibacillus sp. L9]|uniref:DUF4083 domain-containing protein n=1 Tax=Ornithinibacillus caprae TaxID=2678566 RepID=A0A6N8FI61_9BACI|nr:hypothetical protein [Ornithinibacillus caprae]MUK87944.1 hypothetical protein [Ornithinibacillus caprae]
MEFSDLLPFIILVLFSVVFIGFIGFIGIVIKRNQSKGENVSNHDLQKRVERLEEEVRELKDK